MPGPSAKPVSLSVWLVLAGKRANGFEKSQNAYWIERQPRCSILRDML